MLRPARLALLAAVLAAALAVAAPPAGAAPRLVRDWPCAGCLVQVPAARTKVPRPLLVVLHGDEGNPAFIASVWGPVAAAHGMILFAPQCPQALGCSFANGIGGTTSSWWGWLQSGRYDDAWLGQQLSAVERRYKVARAREYVAGWSGGADFLGWYALRHADRFAAAAFVAGGVPYYPRCPAKKLPAYFLDGTADPRYQSGQPGQVQSILQRCGSETQLVAVPGADHQGAVTSLVGGQAAAIVAWMLRHHR